MKSKNNKSVFGFKTKKLSRQEEEKKKKFYVTKDIQKYYNNKEMKPKYHKENILLKFKGIIFQVFIDDKKVYSKKIT